SVMLRSRSSARTLVGVILSAALLSAPVRAAEPNKYLPDGTVVVVTFNFKQLLDAPLVKGDEKAFKQGMGEVGKVLEGFGVDPAKDVSRLVLAAGDQMQPKNILLLVEGRFDPAKVQNKLTEMAKDPKNNLEATTEGTATIYHVKLAQQALPNPAISSTIFLTTLYNDYLAVAVDRDALKAALAKKAGPRK